MGRPTDTQTSPAEEAPVEEGRPGRVVVDSRGRNVWQWARAALDSTSILLKRLENKDLAIEPTQKVPVIPGTEPRASTPPPAGKQAAPRKPGAKQADERASKNSAKRPDALRSNDRGDGGGFDPYNSR